MTSEDLRVKTQYGYIEGFIHEVSNEAPARIFLGVPFAAPPVKELRFEVGFIYLDIILN